MPAKKRPLPPWLMGVAENDPESSQKTNKDGMKDCGLVNPSNPDPASSAMGKKQKPTPPDHTHMDKQQCLTATQIVEMSYPSYSFKGSIIYSYNKDECNLLCDELLSEIGTAKDSVVGFDMEWPVTYDRGRQAKTALIQIAPSVEKCYLFHVSCMPKFPSVLKKIIKSETIKKVGLNISNDFWKLDADYDVGARQIIKTSAIELRTLANRKLKSAENWSLEGLVKNVLRQRLSKDPSVRTCNWSQFPLSEEQLRYAASDAVVSLMLHSKLTKTDTVS